MRVYMRRGIWRYGRVHGGMSRYHCKRGSVHIDEGVTGTSLDRNDRSEQSGNRRPVQEGQWTRVELAKRSDREAVTGAMRLGSSCCMLQLQGHHTCGADAIATGLGQRAEGPSPTPRSLSFLPDPAFRSSLFAPLLSPIHIFLIPPPFIGTRRPCIHP